MRVNKESLIITALFFSVAGFSYLFFDILRYADIPASRGRQPACPCRTFVTVHPGQGFRVTAKSLNKAGIIDYSIKFRLFAYIKGYDKRIKAGEYLFTSAMTPAEILDMMAKGKVFQHKVTVPEGYNLRQIASLIAGAGLGTEEDFLKAASDPFFIRKKGFNAPTFEGYLFPNTYFFPRNIRATQIISAMVRQFDTVFTPEWKTRAEALGLSVHETVTLASIIEKETGNPSERPLIASVFHNRLKKGMRLESDPTVIYGIENFDGNLTRKHLRTSTAYNTYRIKGLPPGPIANPGKESLEAVLYPADTRYLFFVSRKDKTHEFSASLQEHKQAVRKYQLSGH